MSASVQRQTNSIQTTSKGRASLWEILQKDFTMKIHVCRICIGYVENETEFQTEIFPLSWISAISCIVISRVALFASIYQYY